MAQQVRALTALPKFLSSNPSNYMVAYTQQQLLLLGLEKATVYLYIIINKSLGQSEQGLSEAGPTGASGVDRERAEVLKIQFPTTT